MSRNTQIGGAPVENLIGQRAGNLAEVLAFAAERAHAEAAEADAAEASCETVLVPSHNDSHDDSVTRRAPLCELAAQALDAAFAAA